MASNKTGMRNNSTKAGLDLAGTLIKIAAVGIAAGAALIGAAVALGEELLLKQAADEEKLEAQREADKEKVRRIMENDISSDD